MQLRSMFQPLARLSNGVITVLLPATFLLACGDGLSQLDDTLPGIQDGIPFVSAADSVSTPDAVARVSVGASTESVKTTHPKAAAGTSVSQAIRSRTAPTWFTFVALPDTQYYSKNSSLTPIFRAQIDWVMDNRSTHNIAFVAHEGDIVDNGTSTTQWGNAMFALQPLIALDATLPFALNRGNHDDPFFYVKNVGPQLYQNRDWYAVVSPNGLNTVSVFQAAGRSFAHVGINMNPSQDDLAWANTMLSQDEFADLPTIVTTHDYLVRSARSFTGEAIWEGLVKRNPQIFMVLNGHTHAEYRMVSTNAAGKPVYQMLADYQGREDGGQGLMRLIKIDVKGGTLDVKTFSPGYEIIQKGAIKKVPPFYEHDADSEFSYAVDLNPPTPRLMLPSQ